MQTQGHEQAGTNNEPIRDGGVAEKQVFRASTRRRVVRRSLSIAVMLLIAVGLIAAGAYWHQAIGGWFGRGGGGERSDAQAAAAEGRLWTCGMHPQVIQDKPGTCPICHMKLEPLALVQSGGSKMGGAAAGGERKILYWWDPMLGPSSISDKPGKSAMGMDLVPVYEDEVSGGTAVTIDPVVVQNMGVRVGEVTRGPINRMIRAVGYLEEAQPLVHDVNLRVSGWIEKLYADTEGMHLRKGDPLFELYSPEVQVAVEELIAARKAVGSLGPQADHLAQRNTQTIVESARRKLEQWGLDNEQIEKLASLDKAPRTITFRSPITGHLTQKNVVEGASVRAGERALQLVNHSVLWLDSQVYEQDLPFIKLGQKVTAVVDAMRGKRLEGEVIFIHPHVDPVTRTAKVRMELPNPDLSLRPGMYATAQISAQIADEALLVPREAVIDTGKREVVFIAVADGRFEPRNVELGAFNSDGTVQVLSGLAPGEQVVTSGQFLLDSESRMREAIQKHLDEKLLVKGGRAKVPPGAPGSHEMHSNASVPVDASARRDPGVPGAADGGARLAWRPDVDRVYTEYLEIYQALAAPQTTDTALDLTKLVTAARALVEATPVPEQKLPKNVLEAAAAMEGKSLDEQRKLFKALSEAVIVMAEVCPPSSALGEKLFVAYCPMAFDNAGASWLQADKTINNPYYPVEMKQCGEIKATIETARDPR
ncbi:MAG TPA: efflux RND transporter periplasmic adaptor subunit [Tepidisphaeraceae bacterium]|nr:efflux RND transporter periplasmic adaptor subunit [Tepidisphaeraceae bacterium]